MILVKGSSSKHFDCYGCAQAVFNFHCYGCAQAVFSSTVMHGCPQGVFVFKIWKENPAVKLHVHGIYNVHGVLQAELSQVQQSLRQVQQSLVKFSRVYVKFSRVYVKFSRVYGTSSSAEFYVKFQ